MCVCVCVCVCGALFTVHCELIPNSAKHTHTHTHQYGPNKTCSHTIEPTTMYFNWLF